MLSDFVLKDRVIGDLMKWFCRCTKILRVNCDEFEKRIEIHWKDYPMDGSYLKIYNCYGDVIL